MIKMYSDYLKALLGNKKGQGMVEYGLIIALVAILLIAALIAMKDKIALVFGNITNKLSNP